MSFKTAAKKAVSLSLCFLFFQLNLVQAASVGVVTGNNVNVRIDSDSAAAVISKANEGEQLYILDNLDGWYKISCDDGTEAYITSQFVKITQTDATVTGENVNVRSAASTDAEVLAQLATDEMVSVKGVDGDFYEIYFGSGSGYIHKDFLKGEGLDLVGATPKAEIAPQAAPSSQGSEIISYAKKFLGTPYSYGGTNLTSGVDCSGFTYSVFKNFGVNLNRCSRDQVKNGTSVSKGELQAGDLVFFDTSGSNNGAISHVGIYIGNGDYIHASSGKQYCVTISNLNEAYSARTYVSACRVL